MDISLIKLDFSIFCFQKAFFEQKNEKDVLYKKYKETKWN